MAVVMTALGGFTARCMGRGSTLLLAGVALRPDATVPAPGQGCQDGPVWPGKAWTGDLSAQHRDLLPEHEELGVLGGLPASEQSEPAQD
jgi:hypothetical protein